MRITCLQHVPFEGPAHLAEWAAAAGHSLSVVHVYEIGLPELDTFDALFVLGGPMGVYDTDRFPWLADEMLLVREAIAADRIVLGVCLGAQLIAAALGGDVRPHAHCEIGWFDVDVLAEARDHPLTRELPVRFGAFHWHGDRFEIPDDCVRLFATPACDHQGFARGERVLALQFHLESTVESVDALIAHCADEIDDGPFTQTAEQMTRGTSGLDPMHAILDLLLRRLLQAS
jgi:GMP synthase-like glutamine amidotransferase